MSCSVSTTTPRMSSSVDTHAQPGRPRSTRKTNRIHLACMERRVGLICGTWTELVVNRVMTAQPYWGANSISTVPPYQMLTQQHCWARRRYRVGRPRTRRAKKMMILCVWKLRNSLFCPNLQQSLDNTKSLVYRIFENPAVPRSRRHVRCSPSLKGCSRKG